MDYSNTASDLPLSLDIMRKALDDYIDSPFRMETPRETKERTDQMLLDIRAITARNNP